MKVVLLIATTAVLAFSTFASAQEMPGGLWEIKTKMEIPGMPAEMAGKMGSQTITQCVKPGERKWSEQRNPNDRADKPCQQTDMKTDGNKVSWKMVCKDGTSGEGAITHNGKDAYTMDITMNMKQGSMKMQIDGKRIAASCEKK